MFSPALTKMLLSGTRQKANSERDPFRILTVFGKSCLHYVQVSVGVYSAVISWNLYSLIDLKSFFLLFFPFYIPFEGGQKEHSWQ